MIEYILILTLSASTGDGVSVAVTSIPGFASMDDCQAAGMKWEKEAAVYRIIVSKDATCVPKPRHSASATQ